MTVMGITLIVGASALTGCSLLYNPNNLPKSVTDDAAPPDVPVVVVPDDLMLDAAGPLLLLEGQGVGGSRPAILSIQGSNIAADATVSLVPADGQSSPPMIEVDNAHAVLSFGAIAVPVTLAIDPSRGAGDVMLTVQVTQRGATSLVMRQAKNQVMLHNLPELDAPITNSALLAAQYSRVKVPAGLSFTPSAAGKPAVIRAVASIELGDVHADAAGATPGPGGAGGGAASAKGGGPGGGNPAGLLNGGLLASGSGGGYGSAGGPGGALANPNANPGGPMTGDVFLTAYANNGGSGGGGGGSNPGGGGGGTLELTAGGTLTVGKISANGGAGGGNGGGGSGGAIVLRSGALATLGMISAAGGGASNNGGVGGIGRLRYDVPSLGGTPVMPSTNRRGVAFSDASDDNPLITRDAQQPLKVVSAIASTVMFKVFVLDIDGSTKATAIVTFDTSSVFINPRLSAGYNRVCVTPPGSIPTIPESTNCIDIAYVP